MNMLCCDRDTAFAIHAEVLAGDAVVASSAVLAPDERCHPHQWDFDIRAAIGLAHFSEAWPDALRDGEALTLRLRADPELALQKFQATAYWVCDVVLPLERWETPHDD